jgi:peptide deformylase
MKTYKIISIPDPVLKQVAAPVQSIDDAIRTQMERMLETMYDAPGIGLAANQVGLLNRVVVMDLSRRSKKQEDEGEQPAPDPRTTTTGPVCMINPEIIWSSEELSVMEEGCLSIPQQYADVERPAVVCVQYLDERGQKAELEAAGLLSHCVQHEIDHLNGVLFIDYLSSLKRNMMIRKVEKLKKHEAL